MWIAGPTRNKISTMFQRNEIDMPSCLNCQRSWLIWFLCFILHEIMYDDAIGSIVFAISILRLSGCLSRSKRTSSSIKQTSMARASKKIGLWFPDSSQNSFRWISTGYHLKENAEAKKTIKMRCIIDVNANPSNSDPKYSFEMPFLLPFFNATFTKKTLTVAPTWRSSPLGHGSAIWLSKSSMSCTSTTKGPRSLGCPWRKDGMSGWTVFFWLRTSKNWNNRGIFLETKNWGIKWIITGILLLSWR